MPPKVKPPKSMVSSHQKAGIKRQILSAWASIAKPVHTATIIGYTMSQKPVESPCEQMSRISISNSLCVMDSSFRSVLLRSTMHVDTRELCPPKSSFSHSMARASARPIGPQIPPSRILRLCEACCTLVKEYEHALGRQHEACRPSCDMIDSSCARETATMIKQPSPIRWSTTSHFVHGELPGGSRQHAMMESCHWRELTGEVEGSCGAIRSWKGRATVCSYQASQHSGCSGRFVFSCLSVSCFCPKKV